MYFFYIFQCKDHTLYCGSTPDLIKRELAHNNGTGAKYTRSRGGGKIIYSEKFRSKSKAMKREAEVKKWPRAKKLILVQI